MVLTNIKFIRMQQSRLSKMETGRILPSSSTLEKIAGALKVPLEVLQKPIDNGSIYHRSGYETDKNS